MGKKKNRGVRLWKLQLVIAVYLLLAAMLVLVQKNVAYQQTKDRAPGLLSSERLPEKEALTQKECLIVWQEGDEVSGQGLCLMEDILSQMKIGYDAVGCGDFSVGELERYGCAALAVTEWNCLGEKLLELLNWVERGGNLMVVYPPSLDESFSVVREKLGIRSVNDDPAVVEAICFPRTFMAGCRELAVTDPYESSLAVLLNRDCEVFLESSASRPTPLLWRRKLSEGRIVFNNMTFLEKVYRGFFCAAYSLLGEVCVYPVINGSAFFLDDFPSPVPEGESRYITKDYGMGIRDFYTRVWWNDVQNLAKRYGVRYTGMVIEAYSDRVEPPFEQNEEIRRFLYFGNLLLGQGGEIGFHGYNHMPLCLENFDYNGEYDGYRLWKSRDDMRLGLTELKNFCSRLFPKETVRVYVPPSNILSEEGRELIASEFPQLKVIAATYLEGDLGYEQEFEVAQDGIVEVPRTVSGCLVDDYMKMTAFSELNFHFVNSHFYHPDDILDEDRGAALGWKELYSRLSSYMEWLYTSAPTIRNLTASELAAAVQRYDRIVPERSVSKGHLVLELKGFVDEAWFFVRFNEGSPQETAGGSLVELADGLYLLEAKSSRVEITYSHG